MDGEETTMDKWEMELKCMFLLPQKLVADLPLGQRFPLLGIFQQEYVVVLSTHGALTIPDN